MHWLSPLFYMEAKFGPLKKKGKNDWHQPRWNFSEQQLGTPFSATKEILEELKAEQLTRN